MSKVPCGHARSVLIKEAGAPSIPWMKAAFEWRRLVILFLLAGFTTRFVTGVAFDLLSIPAGWSGIATLLAVYGAIVGVPVHMDGRVASLAAIAFGWEGERAGGPLPRATRRAARMVLFSGAIPIAVALATMPGSGHVVDDGTWVLMAVAVGAVQLWVIFVEGRRRPRRRRVRRESRS